MSITAPGRYDGLIMRILRDDGSRSRSRLSAETGLSPTTITKAVAPLLSRGWVREQTGTGTEPVRVGRPAIALEQVPEAVTVGAIQLGVGTARIGLADGWARPLDAEQITFDRHEDAGIVLDRVAEVMTALIERSDHPAPLAVGLATPGTVDKAHRSTRIMINFDWGPLPLADLLEERIGLLVWIDHNVRAMALSETRYGGHDGDCMAYVYVRTGVGLGLVLHGEPFFGGTHGVTEIAHTRVADNGIVCPCGAEGCLETVVAEPYLANRLRAIDPSIDLSPGVMTTLDEGRDHPEIDAVRSDVIRQLSLALASVVNLLSPDTLLVGGALADAPEPFVAQLTDAVRAEVFPILRDAFRVERPRLPDTGVGAGAAVALETALYGDPT